VPIVEAARCLSAGGFLCISHRVKTDMLDNYLDFIHFCPRQSKPH
jgi:hypothetical protein